MIKNQLIITTSKINSSFVTIYNVYIITTYCIISSTCRNS